MVPWYHELAKSLVAQKSVQITFLTFSQKQLERVKIEKMNGIDQIVIKSPPVWLDIISWKLIRISRVKKKAREIARNFDLIHIHGTEHQFQACVSGIDIPIITSIQGVLSIYKKFVPTFSKIWLSWATGALYEQKAIRQNNNYFCRTRWDKAFVNRFNPGAQIFHCWEMIRKDFFRLELDPCQQKGILFLGGSNEIKGYRELLIAVNECVHALDGAILYIAGAIDQQKIEEYISANNLNNISKKNLKLMGHLELKEHLELFSKCRILAHPSYIDNSPNTVCEAQIGGLPVLATDVGGVSSLIEHRKTGYLVEGNIKSLAKGLQDLFNDQELITEISSKALLTGRRRHDEQEIIANTISAYEFILEEKTYA